MNYKFAFGIDEYDDKIKRIIPYYDEFYKQVVDVVHAHNFPPDIHEGDFPIPGRLTWLDVGCGTGKMAELALNKLDIEHFVFCDCSSDMIEKARSRYDCAYAEFLTKSVQDLEFRGKFDVVTAILVNHYFKGEERITAIQKCYDALKAGGIFITYENFAPASEIGKKLDLDRWQSYQLSQGRSPEEVRDHLSRYGREYFPITLSEHFNILKSCGFEAVEVFWLSYMQVGFMGIK